MPLYYQISGTGKSIMHGQELIRRKQTDKHLYYVYIMYVSVYICVGIYICNMSGIEYIYH